MALRRVDAGFTLIEVLISMTLLALLTASLYSLLHLATDARARISAHLDQAEAERVSDRYLSHQLGRALQTGSPAFSGTAQAMQFAVPDRRFGTAGICRVYLTTGRDGIAVYTQAQMGADSDLGPPARLLHDLRAASFAYFGRSTDRSSTWQDRWDARDNLPALVRFDYRDQRGAMRSAYYTVGAPGSAGR